MSILSSHHECTWYIVMAVTKLIIYGTSKIRLVTQVGKVSGKTGATCNAHIDFPGTLKLCGHH